MEEIQRTPCPKRILEDTGGAFLIGAIGSSILYVFKGMRTMPLGHKTRAISTLIRQRSPNVAGNFAMWGFAFSVCECTLVGIRKKEDALNSILSGGFAGALLSIHKGQRTIRSSAFFGFLILALIEGASHGIQVMMTKYMTPIDMINNPPDINKKDTKSEPIIDNDLTNTKSWFNQTSPTYQNN